MAKQVVQEQIILNSKIIEEILHKQSMGYKIKQNEKIWFDNKIGIRKSNLNFSMTNEELEEYFKCKMSVHYFAEQFCKIKREDGTIGPLTLRDYQKDIIDLYVNNRFSILCASRQSGKCSSPTTKVTILDTSTNEKFEIPLYKLYYETIKLERKLTNIEKLKYFLYSLIRN